MINLLAGDRKAELAAARTNVIILRYTGIVVLATIFMLGALGASYGILSYTMQNAESTIASNNQKAANYSDTQSEVSSLETQLSAAKANLTQEVQYSKILIALGQAMPEGAIVGKIDLKADLFNSVPGEMVVFASSADDAPTIQAQLQNSPSLLFGSINIRSAEADGGTVAYPAVITFDITLNRTGQ